MFDVYIFWGSIGVLALSLLIGFLYGLGRGLKRSSLHLLFFVVSMVVAFFVTKPIVQALLGIEIVFEGEKLALNQIILNMVNKSFVYNCVTSALLYF